MNGVACGKNQKTCSKINKKLVTTKIGSGDKFLAKIKFFKPGKAKCAPLDIVPLLPLSFFSIFGMSFFWDSLTFSFSFFYIFSSLRSSKEVTIENMSLNK